MTLRPIAVRRQTDVEQDAISATRFPDGDVYVSITSADGQHVAVMLTAEQWADVVSL